MSLQWFDDYQAKMEDKELERLREHEEKKQELIRATFDLISSLTNSLSSIIGSSYDKQLQDLSSFHNEELEKLEDYYDAQIEAAGENAELIAKLREEYAEKDEELRDEYAEKERQLQYDAAKREKALAIFDSIINTAAAVVKALPNIPLSIFAGLTGAAQTAAIAAQPLPALAEGGVTPALLHPDEAIIPLHDTEAWSRIIGAIENARSTVNVQYPKAEPIYNVIQMDGSKLFEVITKGSRDRRLLIDAGAIA